MIALKELLQHARHEIEASARERIASGAAPLLKVDTVTIEAHVVVTKSGGGDGGFSIGVVTASGKAEYSEQQVQKITIVLKAVTESALERTMKSYSAPSISDDVPPTPPSARAPVRKK